MTIYRESAQHRDNTIKHQQFASGSSIRQSLINQETDWYKVVPQNIKSLYQNQMTTVEDTFPYIKHQLLTQYTNTLNTIYTVSEGFENRLKQSSKMSIRLKNY